MISPGCEVQGELWYVTNPCVNYENYYFHIFYSLSICFLFADQCSEDPCNSFAFDWPTQNIHRRCRPIVLKIYQSCDWRQGLPNSDFKLQDHGRL